jgi:hypothetical protein
VFIYKYIRSLAREIMDGDPSFHQVHGVNTQAPNMHTLADLHTSRSLLSLSPLAAADSITRAQHQLGSHTAQRREFASHLSLDIG